jgi:protein with PEP-CTERM/exosortase system signal
MKLNMKTNIVPPIKLALLCAAVCAVMLAFSQNASATPHPLPPVTSLAIGDGHELGKVFFGEPSGNANRTAYVNAMIGLPLGGSTHVDYSPPAFQNNLVTRSNNNFGSLPQPAVLALNGTGTSVDLGDGTLYSYLFAKYDGKNGGCEVWYVGKLSGIITIPAFGFGPPGTTKYGLSGWTLFGPGVSGVPDSGATVMLLGAALGALGMARRFLTS